MEKHGFVYIWFDRKHKRYYVGCHWGTETDGYICSSTWMRNSYKNRPDDFKRRILPGRYKTRYDTFVAEQKYLDLIKPEEKSVRYYNLSLTNKHNSDSHYNGRNISINEKISATAKKNAQNPEYRAKYLEGLRTRDNKSSDPDTRDKRSKSMMGKNKGKITAKDLDGNIFHTTKDDPRWIAGEIWAASKGIKRPSISEEHKQKIKDTTIFKTLNNKKVSCIHCGSVGNPGNIGRYHNDRCKSKKLDCVGG